MNASQLLAHFDRISEAPGAVPRLRRFILDLAVRGRLVEQDPGDEPASELLKRIEAKKRSLGQRQRNARLADTARLPFELRPGWKAATIEEVVLELQTGPFGSSLHQSDIGRFKSEMSGSSEYRLSRLDGLPARISGAWAQEKLAYLNKYMSIFNVAIRTNGAACLVDRSGHAE